MLNNIPRCTTRLLFWSFTSEEFPVLAGHGGIQPLHRAALRWEATTPEVFTSCADPGENRGGTSTVKGLATGLIPLRAVVYPLAGVRVSTRRASARVITARTRIR